MLFILLLACVLVLFAAFQSDPADPESVTRPSDESSAMVDRKEKSEQKNSLMKFRKKRNSAKKGKVGGRLSEEAAVKLVLGRVLAEHDKEESQVDRSSGRILDENEDACLIGFDIVSPESADFLYTEIYWINRRTLRVKDICSVQEYRAGMIDITDGELLADRFEKEAGVSAEEKPQ